MRTHGPTHPPLTWVVTLNPPNNSSSEVPSYFTKEKTGVQKCQVTRLRPLPTSAGLGVSCPNGPGASVWLYTALPRAVSVSSGGGSPVRPQIGTYLRAIQVCDKEALQVLIWEYREALVSRWAANLETKQTGLTVLFYLKPLKKWHDWQQRCSRFLTHQHNTPAPAACVARTRVLPAASWCPAQASTYWRTGFISSPLRLLLRYIRARSLCWPKTTREVCSLWISPGY